MFVELSDNLNSLEPVANFNTSFLGMINEPSITPEPFDVNTPALLGCEVSPSNVVTLFVDEIV